MTELTVYDISLSSWPLIHKAAYCGNYEILEEELNNGVDPNFKVDGFESKLKLYFSNQKIIIYFNNMTPIYVATVMGRTKCVGLLLARGADPTIKAYNKYYNMDSCSSLGASIWFTNLACYRLIKNHIKCQRGNNSATKYLLAD
jgi:ankyrin repeat protein